MDVEAPDGLSLQAFVPERVPEKIWGEVRYGLKLLPGETFVTKPGEDRTLFFRLKAGDVAPGEHEATIRFRPQKAKETALTLKVLVHPIRFPDHPYMIFGVNNVVNYLCAKQEGNVWTWSETKARNYLADMQQHGVRTQTMIGTNAPSSHYYYKQVRDRETGLSLPEAIKANPERFRVAHPPPLDFAYWDWLVDRMVQHGTTGVRWPMGGCGSRFLTGHAALTKLVYGQTFSPGDIRHQNVQEWYFRELARYLRDRGISRVRCTIDDEIPSEKLSWWAQHAFRCIQMGLLPGVTQSAKTLHDDKLINMVAPFMRYWIIGTLHKATLDKRRKQNIIKPGHWVITYHSSACHWQTYDQMRGHCGLNPAYFDLDGCWIQVYYRWRQSEAVIYPGPDGPTSSAAWEGARDGLDDGNYLLLARTMVRAVEDAAAKQQYEQRLEHIVGEQVFSLVRFCEQPSRLGTLTVMQNRKGTALFRKAKRALLDLILELKDQVPVQKANVLFGEHCLIRDGVPVLRVPEGMTFAPKAKEFLKAAAGSLEYRPRAASGAGPGVASPVFYCGTLPELKSKLPDLAKREELADLTDSYPPAGSFVIRFIESKPSGRKKGAQTEAKPASLVIVCGDEAGADKALAQILNVLTTPKTQYSHWLIDHWKQ